MAKLPVLKNALKAGPVGRLLDPRGKATFLAGCPANARLLDVGCGSNSPYFTKTLRPDIHYVGLDIGDYCQTSESIALADCYLIATPEEFDLAIARQPGAFDAVISSHNIEHCCEPDKVLLAMLGALKPAGRLFLCFPCAASVAFPHRNGTLNFFDDPSHTRVPDYDRIVDVIRRNGFRITFAARRYRPALAFLLGALMEPLSALAGRVVPRLTWGLYGFESVIWATKGPAQ